VQAGDYERALPLLRQAVRLAPFRKDLKRRLSAALDGATQPEARLPGAMESADTFDAPAGPPVMAAKHRQEFTPHSAPRQASSGRAPRRTIPAPAGRTPHRPANFEKRHQRGPLSAWLVGAAVGLVLVAGAVGIAWLYIDLPAVELNGSGRPKMKPSQVDAIVEQANSYLRKGEFALAIDKLDSLSPGRQRDQLLAKAYMDQGDRYFNREPRLLEGALEAYKQAVLHDDSNPSYGNALGQVYLDLGKVKGEKDPADARQFMALARQTYEAVLQRHPENLRALEGLAQVATAQGDDVLKANTYRRIVEVAPDSPAANDARRNMRMLGYRE
jgi:tetratricopeptide (TPR) repeat protein